MHTLVSGNSLWPVTTQGVRTAIGPSASHTHTHTHTHTLHGSPKVVTVAAFERRMGIVTTAARRLLRCDVALLPVLLVIFYQNIFFDKLVIYNEYLLSDRYMLGKFRED